VKYKSIQSVILASTLFIAPLALAHIGSKKAKDDETRISADDNIESNFRQAILDIDSTDLLQLLSAYSFKPRFLNGLFVDVISYFSDPKELIHAFIKNGASPNARAARYPGGILAKIIREQYIEVNVGPHLDNIKARNYGLINAFVDYASKFRKEIGISNRMTALHLTFIDFIKSCIKFSKEDQALVNKVAVEYLRQISEELNLMQRLIVTFPYDSAESELFLGRIQGVWEEMATKYPQSLEAIRKGLLKLKSVANFTKILPPSRDQD